MLSISCNVFPKVCSEILKAFQPKINVILVDTKLEYNNTQTN